MTLPEHDPTPVPAPDTPANAPADTRYFGIRHHGPGCARSLQRALAHWQPDCILIEGPPDADAQLGFVTHAGLVPPVALLVHSTDHPDLAAFYPFTVFSPEWQALRHGTTHGVPTRFIDLPQAVRMAQQKASDEARKAEQKAAGAAAPSHPPENTADNATEGSEEAEISSETQAPDDNGTLPAHIDPLDALAEAAGFADGESWWNHLVEERGPDGDGLALFDAITEAMTVLRDTWPQAYRGHSEAGRAEEALREAHMRQCVREAQKAGHQRIAVVCGAWHVPALKPATVPAFMPAEIDTQASDKERAQAEKAHIKAETARLAAHLAAEKAADKADKALAKADVALLKGLPRLKVSATWVPWTYGHLTRASGYGAGITAPGWYDFLWHLPPQADRATGWLSRVARLLRAHQIDCSSAHIIEAIRLSDTLAALRGHSTPGLQDMDEAVRTTVFMGDATPLQLIHSALTVSQRLGQVPPDVPAVPLQRDLEQQQKSLRLKPEALERTLELDLRNATDLARSHLLHRLGLLGMAWGRQGGGRGSRGTFRETWVLRWEPELSIKLIEASRYGSTVANAATACITEQCQTLESLPALAALVDQALLADLEAAVHAVSASLQSRAATTGDALQLIGAVPPLARVFRYGSVRQTDSALLAHVLDGLITRGAIGLPLACQGLNESAATELRDPLLAAHEAIGLHAQTKDSDEQLALWHRALVQMAQGELPHPLLRGLCTRLLLDGGQWPGDEAATQLSRQLSSGAPPLDAAHWLEGFLNRNAMVLLHDETVWGLVDAWLESLTDAHFMQVVPLVRRSFAAFSASERHDLGQRARRGRQSGLGTASADTGSMAGTGTDVDADRAALAIPLLRLILGIPA
ncbi:MAG: DUF5682 family protein [Hydrogenophaga sp.]|uniref:DUF5682 family protein n=1 Tax=Hydrogenophaga sp. TaxID=1904254 RepID=UPI00271B8763|nr:DUF5682 family protein [Hydrogenophaga sp.]MDO9482320.1 DUF5682 family protein [Hydrogenophaga sp.]MDP3347650.1 DUF5682 family protein [Hydrogenophaga sp.]MDP3806156.1 DUF5682 family protein [Hydrogenophaga sp.]